MKIRFCEPVVGYAAGEEHDLPPDQANAYVQSGLASKTEETRFATPATLRRESDPVSTPPILASLEAGNVADAGPLGSGNPPASRTTAAASTLDGPLPAPGPKARAPRTR